MSGIRLLDCSKLTKLLQKWQWCHNLQTWHHRQFFFIFVSLVKCSCCSKFHVNIITGSGFMTIFFMRDWLEIWRLKIPPAWVLPNIWRLGRVRGTIFGPYVSNKRLLNAAKCQGYSFLHFWVIKGEPTGVKLSPSPFPTQIRVKYANGCKWGSFYNCLVAIYYFETVLKNFGKWCH